MGTGKSAVGERLAEQTNRTFVDIDDEIILKHGAIPDIFANHGEEEFRKLERAVVAEVATRRDLVVATGGGTMLDEENVVAFLGAEIVALTASVEEIVERVTADGVETRPLLADADDIPAEIERLLESRADAYNRFDTVDTTGKSLEEVVDAIGATGTDVAPPPIEATTDETKERILYAVITVMMLISIAIVIAILSF